jgi:hypothetical protein
VVPVITGIIIHLMFHTRLSLSLSLYTWTPALHFLSRSLLFDIPVSRYYHTFQYACFHLFLIIISGKFTVTSPSVCIP